MHNSPFVRRGSKDGNDSDSITVDDYCSNPPTPGTQTLNALSQPQLSFRGTPSLFQENGAKESSTSIQEDSKPESKPTSENVKTKHESSAVLPGGKKAPRTHKKPVDMIDSKTGKILQSFDSAAEAYRSTQIAKWTFHTLLKTGKTAGDKIFRYRTTDTIEPMRGSAVHTKKVSPVKLLRETKFRSSPNKRDISTKKQRGKQIPISIQKIDPKTLECEAEYPSIRQASLAAKVPKNTMRDVLDLDSIVAGGYWRRKQEHVSSNNVSTVFKNNELTKPTKRNAKAISIQKICPKTGNCVEEFLSIRKAAAKFKISATEMSRILDSKEIVFGGYWRRKQKHSPATKVITSTVSPVDGAENEGTKQSRVSPPITAAANRSLSALNALPPAPHAESKSHERPEYILEMLNFQTNEVLRRFSSFTEAAEALGIPSSTVFNRFSKGEVVDDTVWRRVRIDSKVAQQAEVTTPTETPSSPVLTFKEGDEMSLAGSSQTAAESNKTIVSQLNVVSVDKAVLLPPSGKAVPSSPQHVKNMATNATTRLELPWNTVRDYGDYAVFRLRIDFEGSLNIVIRNGQPDKNLIEALDLHVSNELENNCCYVSSIPETSPLFGYLHDADWLVAPIEGSSSLGFELVEFKEAKKMTQRLRPFSLYVVRCNSTGVEKSSSNNQWKVMATQKIAPFCALCQGSSVDMKVHHPWCPEHRHSGGTKTFERICRGVLLDCKTCAREFETGVLVKKGIHTCKKLTDTSDAEKKDKYPVVNPPAHSSTKVQLPEAAKADEENSTKNKKRGLEPILSDNLPRKKEREPILHSNQVKAKVYIEQPVFVQESDAVTSTNRTDENMAEEEFASSRDIEWVSCADPWGPMEIRMDDFVILAPKLLGKSHLDGPDQTERFTPLPFSHHRYRLTHFTPEEKLDCIVLTRDPSCSHSWGFSIYRHEFGGACLVKYVDTYSPANTATLLGTDGSPACLTAEDMILSINGKHVGGMTELEVEVEIEAGGEILTLVVAPYRARQEKRKQLAQEEDDDLRKLDLAISDDTDLHWVDLWNPKETPSSQPTVENNSITPLRLATHHDNGPKNPIHPDLTSDREDDSTCNEKSEEEEPFIPGQGSDADTESAVCVGCVCGKNHRGAVFWLQCDGGCEVWYEVSSKCVGFGQDDADFVDKWICWSCRNIQGLDGSSENRPVERVVENVETDNSLPEQRNASPVEKHPFNAGDMVWVKKHSWPGVDVEEGVATVVKTYFDNENDAVCDIKYAIGRSARAVLCTYILPHSFD